MNIYIILAYKWLQLSFQSEVVRMFAATIKCCRFILFSQNLQQTSKLPLAIQRNPSCMAGTLEAELKLIKLIKKMALESKHQSYPTHTWALPCQRLQQHQQPSRFGPKWNSSNDLFGWSTHSHAKEVSALFLVSSWGVKTGGARLGLWQLQLWVLSDSTACPQSSGNLLWHFFDFSCWNTSSPPLFCWSLNCLEQNSRELMLRPSLCLKICWKKLKMKLPHLRPYISLSMETSAPAARWNLFNILRFASFLSSSDLGLA